MPVGHEANRGLAIKRRKDKQLLHRIIRDGPSGGQPAREIAESAGLNMNRAASLLIEMVTVDKKITRYLRDVGKKKRYFYRLKAGDRQEMQLFD